MNRAFFAKVVQGRLSRAAHSWVAKVTGRHSLRPLSIPTCRGKHSHRPGRPPNIRDGTVRYSNIAPHSYKTVTLSDAPIRSDSSNIARMSPSVRRGIVPLALILAGLATCAMALRLPFLQTRSNPATGRSLGDLSGSYAVSRALVIGINRYPQPPGPLQFAKQDAMQIADELQKDYGFDPKDVVTLVDDQATLARIRRELSALARAGKDDRVLIFFAGHGETNNGRGFFLPVDAKVTPDDGASLMETALPMRQVFDYLDQCPAKHVLVLADACFSGQLTDRGSRLDQASAQVLMRRTVREVITAGTKEEVSTEDPKLGHGIFSAEVLQELKARARGGAGTFTAHELFAAVQVGVENSTGGRQTPTIRVVDGNGEFLFRAPTESAATTGGSFTEKKTAASMRVTAKDGAGNSIAGLEVSVDGKQSAPDFEVDLGDQPKRTIEVTVKASGFKTKVLQVQLERGKETPIDLILEPNSSTANRFDPGAISPKEFWKSLADMFPDLRSGFEDLCATELTDLEKSLGRGRGDEYVAKKWPSIGGPAWIQRNGTQGLQMNVPIQLCETEGEAEDFAKVICEKLGLDAHSGEIAKDGSEVYPNANTGGGRPVIDRWTYGHEQGEVYLRLKIFLGSKGGVLETVLAISKVSQDYLYFSHTIKTRAELKDHVRKWLLQWVLFPHP